jgi:DNA-binding transcriptional MerR regulator
VIVSDPEYRVEDLAERSGTSVDTIRFYQKRRLLDPPRRDGRIAWYGTEHLERLDRIRVLRDRGLSLALIGRLVRGELDAADEPLAAAVVAAGSDDHDEPTFDIAGLAARVGVPSDAITAIVGTGLLVAREHNGEARYTESDARALRAGIELVGAGLPVDGLLALSRDHHARTRATAEQAVALFDAHVRGPLRDAGISDSEKARQLVAAFEVMLPAVTELVEHHFRSVLLSVAREHLESVGVDTP